MKQTLAWHKEVLSDTMENVRREREELARRMVQLEASNNRLTFATAQLEEAIRLGKDGFDAEKFMVKKPKKTS